MKEIEFYDVKLREKIKLGLSSVKKTRYSRTLKDGSSQTRYAFRGQTSDGRNLTKFCSEVDFNATDVAEVTT